MPRVLLGVTGSVAAIRTPELAAALRREGCEVKVLATDAATYFFDPSDERLSPLSPGVRNPETVVLDADEWPGREAGRRYVRGDLVRHIELRRWAEVLAVAPLDANTLAKFAGGLCDNCLTCVWRAWDPARPVVLAPAMNTLMWEHPITSRQLVAVGQDFAANLKIVPPQEKRLACGDVGFGAMADVEEIVAAVLAAEHS